MKDIRKNPRVLIVTPEVTYLPHGMGNIANYLGAKAGGLADVSAALTSALFEQGSDVHISIPDYRFLYNRRLPPPLRRGIRTIRNNIPDERVHLAQDRSFFYLNRVYTNYLWENAKIAIAFQREVINNIIPRVQPDLIHCNDWMTGLIPAMARQMGIPCLFTIHNIHTVKCALSAIEDRGIDAAEFWQNLYFEWVPGSYEEIRDFNPVDFLASGTFAAHFVNTVSPTFLMEVVRGRHSFVPAHIGRELANKVEAECAAGILNAPDPSFNPSRDSYLEYQYSAQNHSIGKKTNKRLLQRRLGLIQDDKAPLFFWPSRLDPVQKGCQLLAEIFYQIISGYWSQNLEIVFVSDGDFKQVFKNIIRFHGFHNRVKICDYDEKLARLAYAASDFVLMPSLFEPCGLPQMIGTIYGALPIAHDTGGIHDTIRHLNVEQNKGNGFLFETYDSNGLFWAINQAMEFYNLPLQVRNNNVERVMLQADAVFNHTVTAHQYIKLYERMLQRPLIANHKIFRPIKQDKIHKNILRPFENLSRHQHRFMQDAIFRFVQSIKKATKGKKGG
jgi:starch synthase/alpha-amylase